MRYIDADKELYNLSDDLPYKASVRRVLMQAPEADVAEVRHGHNATSMHPVDEFVCSVCGFICNDYIEAVYDEDGDYTYYRECEFKYCPNCGAKMDEGVKEDEK